MQPYFMQCPVDGVKSNAHMHKLHCVAANRMQNGRDGS